MAVVRRVGFSAPYHSLCLPECDTVPKVPVDTAALKLRYAASEPPTFSGHPRLPLATVACVDYSVGKPGGMLTAFRWDGERVLDAGKVETVAR